MKASDLLVKCFEEEGIEYVFGVPGEENADFMMSLEQSDSIKFILTRHEQGAAFMADAYGRLTGNPAVCLGTLGPGATNLITGVANANMDRSPMLVLTAQADSKRQHKESHQYMDVVSMFNPVTKWAQAILHPENIPEIVRKAVRLREPRNPAPVTSNWPKISLSLRWTAYLLPSVVSGARARTTRSLTEPLTCSRKRPGRLFLPATDAFEREPASNSESFATGLASALSAHSWQREPLTSTRTMRSLRWVFSLETLFLMRSKTRTWS